MENRGTRAVVSVMLVSLLAGCGSDAYISSDDTSSSAGGGAADAPQSRIVVGATATANEPAIKLGPDETNRIRAAVDRGTVNLTAFVGSRTDQPVLDQDMSVYYDRATGELDTDPGRIHSMFEDNMEQVRKVLEPRASEQADLDLLSLLGIMAKTPSPATLLVYSSGLQTTGMLDLRGQGSDLDVEATVARLPLDQLPDLTSKRVIFIGLGQVAGPQRRLTEAMYKQVHALWLAVCAKAGGDCDSRILRATGGPPRSTVDVPTVPVPSLSAVTVWGDLNTGRIATIKLPNGALFKKDRATYVPGGEQMVRDMAPYFRDDGESTPVRATAVGHTATYGPRPGALRLSELRAQKVVKTLVDAGVRPELFNVVKGVGFDEPLVPDLDANRRLIPEAAEQNRTVVLTVTRVWSKS